MGALAYAGIPTLSARGRGGRICAPGSTFHTDPSRGRTGRRALEYPTGQHLQKKTNHGARFKRGASPPPSFPLSHPLLHELLTSPFLSFSLSRSEHPLLNCVLIRQALNKYIPRERRLRNMTPSQVIIKHRSQQLSKSGNKEGVGRTDILPVTSSGRDWHPRKPQLQ